MPNYVLSNGVFIPTTYTIAEVDGFLSVIPISRFGDMTDNPLPVTVSGLKVTIGEVPAILAGKKYTLGQTVLTMPNSVNQSRWLFLQIQNGVPGYLLSDTWRVAESHQSMYLGQISTNGSTAVTTSLQKVTRLDKYRISELPKGSCIPASTGDPTGTGNYAW